MRILYVCGDLGIPVLGSKGAAVHVRALITAFSRAGHTVVLAAPVLSKSPWQEHEPVAASVLHVPPGPETAAAARSLGTFVDGLGMASSLPSDLRAVLYQRELLTQLKRRFESAPPDLIYERACVYGTAGATLARGLELPRIVELNAPLAAEQSAYRGSGFVTLAEQAERLTLLQADAVLTVSSALREHVLSLGGEPERVHVVPNGVDGSLFHPAPADPALRMRLGLGKGPVLGFVGGLRPWHGTEALPGLLERLVPKYPTLRLVIAGEGPMREELERDFARRNLLERVVFTGWLPHDEVPALLRQLDVALAPYSHPDYLRYASPLKLFEYMASGTPVVAADLGQTAEIVRHGETGLLYPLGDPDGLAAACENLLADPALRRRLGEQAAAELNGGYSWDANAARVLEVAGGLLEAGERAR